MITSRFSTPAIGSGSYLPGAQPIGRFASPLRPRFNRRMPELTRKRVNNRPSEPGMKKNELLPSDETVNRLAVSCRIAYATMLKSREDLIAMHGKANHELVDELMADLADTAERLKELAEMVEGALRSGAGIGRGCTYSGHQIQEGQR
jgi:hypothetical protein